MAPQEASVPAEEETPDLTVEGIRRVRTKRKAGRPRNVPYKKYNAATHYAIPKKHIDDFVHAGLLGRLDGYMRVALVTKIQEWFNLPNYYVAEERARQMKIASIARKERKDEKDS